MPGAAGSHARFSTYLRRIRLERKLSLRQVEKLSEQLPERVSNSYLAYCETGRLLPSLGKLMSLSKVLGVPLQSFTDRIEMDREAAVAPAGGATWQELRAAGIREAEAGALQSAFTRFESALSLAEEAPARADLTMDLAIVLKRMSRHYMSRDLLEDVISGSQLDDARLDRALILLGDVLREMGKLPLAAMVAREALDRAVRLGDADKEAHAACLLGNALFDLGNADDAAPLYDRAVRRFRASGDLASLVCNLANLGNCLAQRPDRARQAEGLRLLQEAEGIARKEGFRRHLADILGYLGMAQLRQGQAARAEKLFFQSNQIARAEQYHDIVFTNTWHLHRFAVKRGLQKEAADYLRTLRYLRGRVECASAEVRAFDRQLDRPGSADPSEAIGPTRTADA